MRRGEFIIFGPSGEMFPFKGVKTDGKKLQFYIGWRWETIAVYKTRQKAVEVQQEITNRFTSKIHSDYHVPAG